MRSRDVVRDDALREALSHLPATAESCWVRGASEVRVYAKHVTLLAECEGLQ